MTHASLFSGIGGFDLAAEWAGWTNVFNCEIDPFCRKVLAYHFPNAFQYEDIKTTDFRPLRGGVDVLTGGFPCQPFSLAGKRKGTDDNRYLWPEMLRAIREIAPRWVVGENVFGIVNWSDGMVFEQVCADLEDAGYEVQSYLIPACAVDAPHRRDRVWFVAHRRNAENAIGDGLQREFGKRQAKSQEWRQRMSCTGDSKWVRDQARVTTNPDLFGDSAPCACGGADQQGSHLAPREGKRRSGAERPDGLPDVQWPDPDGGHTGAEILQREGTISFCASNATTNAKCDRGGERHKQIQPEKPKRERADSSCKEWSIANSEVARRGVLQDEIRTQRPRMRNELPRIERAIPNWERFPTQSPVCGRDDGVSARLDGITFPRWRRESIKAYGNAVVPQVVLRIFETINEYENN